MDAATATPDSGSTERGSDGRHALELATELLAQTAVLGTALYYFGYAKTQAVLNYFGIDPSLVKLDFQDYLVRSTNSVAVPLLLLGSVWLCVNVSTSALLRRLSPPQTVRFWVTAARVAALGVVLGLIGTMSPWGSPGRPMSFPSLVVLFLSFLVLGYSLSRLTRTGRSFSAPRASVLVSYTLAALLFLAAMSSFAESLGAQQAKHVADNLADLPAITIYSPQRLAIAAPGVEATQLAESDSRYRYSYTNLRLLIRSNDRYFLVSTQWIPGQPVVIVPDNAELRIDSTITSSHQ